MSVLAANRHALVDATAGAVAMTLPTGANDGDVIVVEKYDTTPNAVTVTGSIRGSGATISLILAHQVLGFKADSAGSWWPIWGHLPLSSLDGVYVPSQSTAPDHTVAHGWLDTSTTPPVLKGWDGSAWAAIGGSGGLAVTDNGDGTGTITPSGSTSVTDNGDGTGTIAA